MLLTTKCQQQSMEYMYVQSILSKASTHRLNAVHCTKEHMSVHSLYTKHPMELHTN